MEPSPDRGSGPRDAPGPARDQTAGARLAMWVVFAIVAYTMGVWDFFFHPSRLILHPMISSRFGLWSDPQEAYEPVGGSEVLFTEWEPYLWAAHTVALHEDWDYVCHVSSPKVWECT